MSVTPGGQAPGKTWNGVEAQEGDFVEEPSGPGKEFHYQTSLMQVQERAVKPAACRKREKTEIRPGDQVTGDVGRGEWHAAVTVPTAMGSQIR